MTHDYLNPSLGPDRRTEDLLSRMTLHEKAGLLFHPSTSGPDDNLIPSEALVQAESDIAGGMISHFNVFNGRTAAEIADWHNTLQQLANETRLRIPVTLSSDPRHGFHSTPFTGQSLGSVSRWPETTGIAAIGTPESAREFGDAVRREFLAMGIRVYLGPMADIYSDPRWSRGHGTFGEDPRLASVLTAAFIKGLRGTETLSAASVAAVVKHFPGAGPQKDGNDAHDPRFREQVYPGGQQQLHLQPFEAAFDAGVTQLMTYYGMPVGTEWEEVGFAFNGPVVRDLLRNHYRYDGIVVSDWNLIESVKIAGITFGPNGWGLEHLAPIERLRIALDVGVDQFGGDRCPELIVELVENGSISEARIDQSARRLLHEKFQLGLFENRTVDVGLAETVCGSPETIRRGVAAQRGALTLLTNTQTDDGVHTLPVRAGASVYSEGIDWSGVEHDLVLVNSPSTADFNLVRLDAPFEPDEDSLGGWFHSGSLEFAAPTVEHLRELSSAAPTIVVVYMERPPILTPLLPLAAAVVADFGASDQVVVDAVTSHAGFAGRLPFDLPSSTAAVLASREDVPFDTAVPLFTFGTGLTSQDSLTIPAGSSPRATD
ncbi:glycoside hydrolase family 3 protein [Arthrobacter sp. B2a2-09]|uniref:glycoside hydrolase family 3 protein n=1 Tax=Arthrobacter sp. B2a2-09 TaxID=2952822 RepID=UPI0022CD56A7|nr:glycoside hydrolase family 3 N-terminal domain-containing protein [Arthrobacter sp. B2a2-09]MCZ9882290.1 glycoside hydrolase family 3 protein [Arthrobacter sp. B2a2-09]